MVAGSIFAIVKRKFGLGLGVLVGFFGGLAVIIILAFLLMALPSAQCGKSAAIII